MDNIIYLKDRQQRMMCSNGMEQEKDQSFDERIHNIRASLERINQLMSELRKNTPKGD